MIITISRLDENGRIGQTFGVDDFLVEAQINASSDVTTRVLDGRVAVDVGQLAQAESVVVLAGGIGGLIYFFYRRPRRIKEEHERVKAGFANLGAARDRD